MSEERERVRLHLGDDAHMDVCLPADATFEMVEAFRALCLAAAEYLAATMETTPAHRAPARSGDEAEG